MMLFVRQSVFFVFTYIYGWTLMLIACFNGHLNIVHFLCQNGAKDDVRQPRNNGSTPMFAVCEKGHSNIVQCLFQNGAKDDVRRPTNNGSTPMFIACYNDHFPIVEYLHNHGAAQDINAPSWQQQTPLQITCQNNHLHIVQWFIQQGTPTKTNISTWFNKLNVQNRRVLFQQAIANRDVAHESLISFACVVRNGQATQNILHALDTGLLLEKISSYVEGLQSTRSLWYHIVRHGP